MSQGNNAKRNAIHSSDKHSPDSPISSLPAFLMASLLLCVFALNSGAQTAVLFPLAQMTGTTNDTIITIRPVNNPVKFNSQIYWLPVAGIQLPTKNGSATTNLIPNDYNVTIAGVPGSWKISVNDTNVTLNAAEIGNLTTYTFTDLFGYVKRIIPGTGISISPPGGQGYVTINSTGGGGGGSATNAYQTQAGNKLITITTNLTDFVYTIFGVSQTNGYPWGVLYDAAGTALAATNGLSLASGLSAFRGTNTFDAAGRATAATNGYPWGVLYDAAGAAEAVTNGYPWSPLFDAAGSATAATNGYPWGVLYDAAGAALAATNGISLASGLAAFRGTNTFAATNAATASTRGLVKVDNSTIVVAADGTISATTGGGGSVTSVALTAPGEFSIAGSPLTTSGTLAITRTADADFLGFAATNVGFLKVTNFASIGGQTRLSALIVTNGVTNTALTASTLLSADANKKLTSVANGIGALTNDASGNFGYAPLLDASGLKASQYTATDGSTNLVSTQNGNNWTNTIAWTHEGTTTNITATFNGTLQSFTVTNGPDVFFNYAGANGSVSYRFTTNVTLHFSYQPKWLAGSNSVITNGVLSLTSYGGTNAAQIESAMKENQ